MTKEVSEQNIDQKKSVIKCQKLSRVTKTGQEQRVEEMRLNHKKIDT